MYNRFLILQNKNVKNILNILLITTIFLLTNSKISNALSFFQSDFQSKSEQYESFSPLKFDIFFGNSTLEKIETYQQYKEGLNSLTLNNPITANDKIFFITGGPYDLQFGKTKKALELLREFIKKNIPEASFQVFHNREWEAYCEETQYAESSKNLVFLGHSWGAQATIDIAHCLEEKNLKINLAVTLDSIQKPLHPPGDVIPYNIDENLNYYQRQDKYLIGYAFNHRPDDSFKNIKNEHIVYNNPSWSPHLHLVYELIKNKPEIQKILAHYFLGSN